MGELARLLSGFDVLYCLKHWIYGNGIYTTLALWSFPLRGFSY
jgi:hypothetical protein